MRLIRLAPMLALTLLACRQQDNAELLGGKDGVDNDNDGVVEADDCDDNDPSVYPGATEVPYDGVDNDCNPDTWDDDLDGDGFALADDCDDNDSRVHPNAPEVCDGRDNDCNGIIDDAIGGIWYDDVDADGFGDPNTGSQSCQIGTGQTADSSDCDDNDQAVNIAADEKCDGIDNDCDAQVDEPTAVDARDWFDDVDADGFGDPNVSVRACDRPTGMVEEPSDCDDTDPAVNRLADELCDGIDNDCDGEVDEPSAIDAATWHDDADGDGFGDGNIMQRACSQPNGTVLDSSDCDDADPAVNPAATEICNGVDDDCSTLVDDAAVDATTWYADGDGDGFGSSIYFVTDCTAPNGYVTDNTDCDDLDPANWPGGTEVCDGGDNDCDSGVDEGVQSTWYADGDGDGYGSTTYTAMACAAPNGYVADATDCDDSNATTWPGATEVCDDGDNDCDSSVDEGVLATWYADGDGDGYGNASYSVDDCTPPNGFVADNTDCDDTEPSAYTGATEICNGVDDDCNGTVDDESIVLGHAEQCPAVDCDDILTAGASIGDGDYWLDPDGTQAFQAACDMSTDSGGWTVVDVTYAADWMGFFTSWTDWASDAAGPSSSVSSHSWRGWFTLADSGTEFRLSPDCANVSTASTSQVYHMSGNYYGCRWFNRSCDQSSSGTCTTCYDSYNSNPTLGACTHLTKAPDTTYPYSCGVDWWNTGPSLGNSGTQCVAYRNY